MKKELQKVSTPAGTEVEKRKKAMLQIINAFVEGGWTFKEAIDFLPEVESVLNELSINRQVTID